MGAPPCVSAPRAAVGRVGGEGWGGGEARRGEGWGGGEARGGEVEVAGKGSGGGGGREGTAGWRRRGKGVGRREWWRPWKGRVAAKEWRVAAREVREGGGGGGGGGRGRDGGRRRPWKGEMVAWEVRGGG
ncbi:hypothetical protein GQ55_2G464600 [Panicum hallii var. hallii]|uniref:Uncharacterized protein n=1 Tax=Panicum hallii var. hallii TaxID=1504633 RepID=A0A2T7EZT1_9POAL|nr:hypothetical protein GQ55_2G464600 [Panicum hallii var. hallii]